MKRLSFKNIDIDKIVEDFKQNLINFKSNQDKFIYEKKFSEISKDEEAKIKKPIIYFSMEAWIKMLQLVKTCDKEIAWQATVEKRKFKQKEDSEDFYYFIKQVFVYPQKVTGTFVDVDEVNYTEWSLKLDDEVYNNLRFQGHSHVNMATSPSGTDLNTYQNFLDQLKEDDFYIFMILNKRSEWNIMVYDYKQNILFETKDCFVDVLTTQGSLARWTEENMKQIEFKAEPTYPKTNYIDDWYDTYHRKNKPEEITFVNLKGYYKGMKWYAFKDQTDATEWFLDNPDYIESASIPEDFRKELLFTIKNNKTKTKKKKEKNK